MTQKAPTGPLKLPADFHREMAALVREMESYGWTGRLSTPGHAIMRAPDGNTTASITPKLGSPRHLANNRAVIDRWLREQAERAQEQTPDVVALAAVDTADIPREPGADGLVHCPAADCSFARPTFQPVRIHWAHKHTARVACPFPGCTRTTSAAQAPRHLASHYREPQTVPQLRRDLARTRAELAEAREEVEVYRQIAEEAEEALAILRNALRG